MLLSSCSPSKQLTLEQIVGKYKWSGVYGVGRIVELKPDSSFVYKWQAGLSGGTTVGTWTQVRNKIILNSELQPSDEEAKDFQILSISSNRSDSLTVRVVGPEGEPFIFANCVLKTGSDTLVGTATDFQGIAKLPQLQADSLIVYFFGHKTAKLNLDLTITEVELKLKEEYRYYQFFTNDTWKLKHGRLYDPSIKKDKWVKKDFYEKIK